MNHDIWCRLLCFLPANSTGTFLSYMIVSAFTLVFVVLWVPETKGRTLEEIQWSFRWGLHASSRCNHPMILRVFLLEGNGWFLQLEILGIPPSTNTRWRPRTLSVRTTVCTFLCNAVKSTCKCWGSDSYRIALLPSVLYKIDQECIVKNSHFSILIMNSWWTHAQDSQSWNPT